MTKRLHEMSSDDLAMFYYKFGKVMGVKFIFDPGFFQALVKKLYDRIVGKFAVVEKVSEFFHLKPMCFNRLIFIPYLPGDDDAPLAVDQIETAIHECTHSNRMRRDERKPSRWYSTYFLKDGFRAIEEVQAVLAEREFNFWLTGNNRSLSSTAIKTWLVENYLCGNKAADTAATSIKFELAMLKKRGRGYCSSAASTTAITILKDMGFRNN